MDVQEEGSGLFVIITLMEKALNYSGGGSLAR